MQLICCDPALNFKVWPRIRDGIHRAIKRGGFSAYAPVERNVLSGNSLVWLATDGQSIKAAAITEIQQTEWDKVLIIVAASGRDMKPWLPLIAGLESYGRESGCNKSRIVGRPGWEKMLTEYKRAAIVLERTL